MQAHIESCLKQIGEKEHIDLSEKFHIESRLFTEAFGRDIRKCVHALHFWSETHSQSKNGSHCYGDLNIADDIISLDDSIISLSSQTDTDLKQEATFLQKSKISKKRIRRKSKGIDFKPKSKSDNTDQELVEKHDANKQEKCSKGGFFERACGITSIIQHHLEDQREASTETKYLNERCYFQDILCYLSLIKGKCRLELLEEVLSHLYISSFVQVILLNWKSFLPGLYNAQDFSRVGRMKLPIHVPQSSIVTFDSEIEFPLKNTFQGLVEGIPEYKPQVYKILYHIFYNNI